MNKVQKGVYLFLSNDEVAYNYTDNIYHFRQDSTFLYYFGLNMPNVFGIIDADKGESILFADDIDINMLIWTGAQPSARELADRVGISKLEPTTKLKSFLTPKIGYLPPYRAQHILMLSEYLGITNKQVKDGHSMVMVHAIIEQRSIKSKEELALMDMAVDVSESLHIAVMKSVKPGKYEYEMVAKAEEAVKNFNAGFSYPVIATINGQVLHNHAHHNKMQSGQLFLLDAGAELPSCYAGDLTRTFPVKGKFSSRQKEIYDIVLQAQMGVIEDLKEGVFYKDMHLLSATIIFEGLKSLGLTKGNTDEAVQAGAHALFYPHGLGHMIGLDVHDMENLGEDHVGYGDDISRSTQFGLRSLRLGKKLQEGHVITVEPGIYFIPALIDKWKAEGLHKEFINFDVLEGYKEFGGIRIEDNYVITSTASRRLGFNRLVKKSEDIESEME